jgi:hypothetical protein
MPVVSLQRDCPGYAEAAAREEELRALAVLGLPEIITDGTHRVELAPLTLRRLQWLTMMRCPFLLNLPVANLLEKPNIAADLVSALWVCSPAFKAGAERARRRWLKRHPFLLQMAAEPTMRELMTYLTEAFIDAGHPANSQDERNYYSSAAALTGFFHQHYGLEIDLWENGWARSLVRYLTGKPCILDVPLKLAFQLIRVQQKASNPEMTFYNRLSQPRVEAWMRQQNGRN